MNDLLYKKNIVKQTLYKSIQQQVDIDINVKREKQSTSHWENVGLLQYMIHEPCIVV